MKKYYRVRISQDSDPMHPIHDVECWIGRFFAYHRNYSAGHNRGKGNPRDDLFELWRQYYSDTVDYDIQGSAYDITDEELWEQVQAKHILAPVFMYSHGNVAYQLSSFNDPWDSGQVGFCEISYKEAANHLGMEGKPDEEIRAKVLENWEYLLEEYTDFCNGNCHGFESEYYQHDDTTYELADDGSEPEEIDEDSDVDWETHEGCYGFIGNADDCAEDMAAHAPPIPVSVFKEAADRYGGWVLYESP